MGSQWGVKKLELMKTSCQSGSAHSELEARLWGWLEVLGGMTSIPGHKEIPWQLRLVL